MADEQQLNVSNELNYLRSLIDSIDSQMTVLRRGLEELRRALGVLNDSAIGESPETRMTIGAGIFVKAKINLSEKLVVPVGSEVYIEEEPEKTVKRLENNISEVQQSIEGLSAQRSELANRYESILALMQQQEAGAGKD
jgi:prefoldin alpha subunit